jgi:hypothetical protein
VQSVSQGTSMSGSIPAALDRALARLVIAQHDDGHWEDYELPVGRSDAWVTAYLATALAELRRAGGSSDAAVAAGRGATWLTSRRHHPRGWGYNAEAGPDADSTAWALRALRATGTTIRSADIKLLHAHRRQAGGVATYSDGPGHWSDPHPDVTPVAALALWGAGCHSSIAADLAYLWRMRRPDGSWPAYWWSTSHYSTLLNVELRAVLGYLEGDERPVVLLDDQASRVETAFDLACVLGTVALGRGDSTVRGQLAAELVALQRPDGSWDPSPRLRVTDPACAQPWHAASGNVYSDVDALYTTATAVRALVLCL